MSKLMILGAGGHGKVVAEVAHIMKKWEEIVFLDDNEELKEVVGFPVIDRLGNYKLYKKDFKSAFVAIGNNELRLILIEKLQKEGFKIPNLIHPFTSISSNVDIGMGTVIMAGAVINCNTVLGKGCIINTSSSIDHDCTIEDGVHISPGAHIGGTVKVGKCSWVCIGSNIANNINIGKNSVIAAGSAVIEDVPNNVMVAGVPAIIKKKLKQIK